jgi:cytosine/adenosine deaminase-related metal-dependent hydrolase
MSASVTTVLPVATIAPICCARWDIAAELQKVTLMDPSVLPAEQAFEMATIGGARVLGMQSEIGSLEAGKHADFFSLSLIS